MSRSWRGKNTKIREWRNRESKRVRKAGDKHFPVFPDHILNKHPYKNHRHAPTR